jgi:glutathione S-transferase
VKLYGSTNKKSFNTLKLRAALAEARADYEYVPVDVDKGEGQAAAFLAVNPHGKIPVLVDGDFVLPESNAILWYIADTYPDAQLVPRHDGSPAAIQARARVIQWVDFAQTTLYAAYAEWWNHGLGDAEHRLPALAAAALGRIHRGLGVMDTVLATREHLALPGFSIADLSGASMVFALQRRLPDEPLSKFPHVSAWYARIASRPSFAASLAR